MVDFRDRRVVLVLGAGIAVAAGLGIAVLLASGHSKSGDEPPPASQGGLVVQTGHDEDLKLDPKKPLHCFVSGKLIGDLPLSDCAQRNGVATGALDVGLDPSGALAASNGATPLTPLPPAATPQARVVDGAEPLSADEEATIGDSAACWRFSRAGWRRLPVRMSLDACVQALYGGHCPLAGGGAQYGRWGDSTLRSMPGEVDISSNNRDFSRLAEQAADCSVSPVSSPN